MAQNQTDIEKARAFAAELGIAPMVDRLTGEVFYDPFEIGTALGMSAEDVVEMLVNEPGCVEVIDSNRLQEAK